MAHHVWKRNRTLLLAAALLAAALLIVWFGANQNDFYRASILPDGFSAVESGGETALQSGRLMLEKGSYTFNVAYEAKAGETVTGEAAAEIIDDLAADSQGNPSPVLASVPLDPGQTEAVLTLTLPQTTRGVRVVLRGAVTAGVTAVLSDAPVWNDTAFFMLCLLLLAGLGVWIALRERKGDVLPESLAVAVCAVAVFVASLPALRDFLVYGHDLAFHLTRIESIKDGLLSGQFPVRIDPTFLNGYGYASSVMYGDLFLYVPALLRLCGVSMLVSWQAFLVLLNFFTAYVAYRAVKQWTGKAEVGLIAGVVFTLGIYRLMTLYTRASAGEALAMLFYPPVIVGMVLVLTQGKGVKWLVLGMTGLVQSHLISLQIAALGCALYTLVCVIFRKTSWKNIGKLCLAAGITLLINLWFLVPLLSYSGLDLDIFHQEKQIWLHAAYLPQLFSSFVDPYAAVTTFPGTTAEMPLSVGLLLGLGLVLYLFAAYKKREGQLEDVRLYGIGRGAAAFAILALWMASVAFPWTYVHNVPILGKVLFAVQFPWRYLGAASALLSVVFAVSVWLLFGKPERRRTLVLACLLLAIFNAAPFLDRAVQSENQTVVVKDKAADFVAPVYLPGDYLFEGTDVDAILTRSPAPAVAEGDLQISSYRKDYLHISFDYAALEAAVVEMPLYAYPAYRAMLNGKEELALSQGENHILAVTLPAGGGHVEVTLRQPWTFTLADLLSLLAILALTAREFRARLVRRRLSPRSSPSHTSAPPMGS